MKNKNNKNKLIRNINFIQIIKYYLPITGIISILHRITGIFITILIPLILISIKYILISKENFIIFQNIFNNIFIKILFIIFIEIYIYHLFSGIRYILIDINIGTNKNTAKISSYIVIISTVLVGLIFIIKLLRFI